MFAPPLQLSLDQVRLQVAASPDPTTPNSLVRSKETGGMLTQPNQLRLVAGRRLALREAKRTALMGVAASLVILLLALATFAFATTPPSDEALACEGDTAAGSCASPMHRPDLGSSTSTTSRISRVSRSGTGA
jgi:hypothetical protein